MIVEKLYKYPNCIIVSGYSRNMIQDLFYSKYCFIPDLLSDILKEKNGKTIHEIKIKFGQELTDIIDSYIDFLKENDIAYFTENDINFKELSLEFDYPAIISNAIIILNNSIIKNANSTIIALEKIGCEHLQIYIEDKVVIQDIFPLLDLFNNSRIASIELLFAFDISFSNAENLQELFINQQRLFKILLFNAPLTKQISIDNVMNQKHIVYIEEHVSYQDCACIHPLFFKNNILFFTESQSHNTCLNRKLCIDAEGNIKNCPAMAQSFGNIKDTTLQEAVAKPGFKDLWFICKDQIDVCKDCEFRHMCTDCRCFIKDPENIYSQPAKCTYNPYICEWEGQEGYIPVEECGTYSKETGFVPDKIKIEVLNKQIWGEDHD